MAEKTSAEVIIGGKVYTLSGYEGEEYLQRVATYINNKINEFNNMEELRRLSGDMKATLIQLNIADDYFKARAQVEKLEQEIEQKDKEIYDLKHDLISNQIKAESDEKELKELEAKNQELLLNKAKLEASLEDALLIWAAVSSARGHMPTILRRMNCSRQSTTRISMEDRSI